MRWSGSRASCHLPPLPLASIQPISEDPRSSNRTCWKPLLEEVLVQMQKSTLRGWEEVKVGKTLFNMYFFFLSTSSWELSSREGRHSTGKFRCSKGLEMCVAQLRRQTSLFHSFAWAAFATWSLRFTILQSREWPCLSWGRVSQQLVEERVSMAGLASCSIATWCELGQDI